MISKKIKDFNKFCEYIELKSNSNIFILVLISFPMIVGILFMITMFGKIDFNLGFFEEILRFINYIKDYK